MWYIFIFDVHNIYGKITLIYIGILNCLPETLDGVTEQESLDEIV